MLPVERFTEDPSSPRPVPRLFTCWVCMSSSSRTAHDAVFVGADGVYTGAAAYLRQHRSSLHLQSLASMMSLSEILVHSNLAMYHLIHRCCCTRSCLPRILSRLCHCLDRFVVRPSLFEPHSARVQRSDRGSVSLPTRWICQRAICRRPPNTFTLQTQGRLRSSNFHCVLPSTSQETWSIRWTTSPPYLLPVM